MCRKCLVWDLDDPTIVTLPRHCKARVIQDWKPTFYYYCSALVGDLGAFFLKIKIIITECQFTPGTPKRSNEQKNENMYYMFSLGKRKEPTEPGVYECVKIFEIKIFGIKFSILHDIYEKKKCWNKCCVVIEIHVYWHVLKQIYVVIN